MHQILFRLGLCPRSRWEAYIIPQYPLAGFDGSTAKGQKLKEGRKRERKREEECEGKGVRSRICKMVRKVEEWGRGGAGKERSREGEGEAKERGSRNTASIDS